MWVRGVALQVGSGRSNIHGLTSRRMGYNAASVQRLQRAALHEASSEHLTCAQTHSELPCREQRKQQHVEDTLQARSVVTVDGHAFCDALRCL